MRRKCSRIFIKQEKGEYFNKQGKSVRVLSSEDGARLIFGEMVRFLSRLHFISAGRLLTRTSENPKLKNR